MNIALFTETYLPYINGVVTHVKSLKEGLEKLGHHVLIVCADPHARHHYVSEGVLHCPAVTSKKLYEYGVAPPLAPHRLKLLREFAPDIIHIHQEFGVGLSGVHYAKELDVPLVYTLHTMYQDYLYYIFPDKMIPFARRVMERYVKYLANHASTLFGPSPKVEEFFRECDVVKDVHIMANPVELEIFDKTKVDHTRSAQIKKDLGLTDDDFILAFCGRLGKEKNIDGLLDFWKEGYTPDSHLKLLILGDGPEKGSFERHAASIGVSDSVIFAGRIAHNDLPLYFDFCDLYITASLSDTNSISMKEGLAMGLPVLSLTDELNVGQIVDGINGFNYNNSAELFEEIENYRALDENARTALQDSARDSVMEADCVGLAKHVLPIYERLIEENRQKAGR